MQESMSPSKREFQIQMAKKLNGGVLEEGRVLSFQAKPPSALEVNTKFGILKLF